MYICIYVYYIHTYTHTQSPDLTLSEHFVLLFVDQPCLKTKDPELFFWALSVV